MGKGDLLRCWVVALKLALVEASALAAASMTIASLRLPIEREANLTALALFAIAALFTGVSTQVVLSVTPIGAGRLVLNIWGINLLAILGNGLLQWVVCKFVTILTGGGSSLCTATRLSYAFGTVAVLVIMVSVIFTVALVLLRK